MYLFGLIVFLLKLWIGSVSYSALHIAVGVAVLWGSNTVLLIGTEMSFSAWTNRRYKAGKRPLENGAELRAALFMLTTLAAIWLALQFMPYTRSYFPG